MPGKILGGLQTDAAVVDDQASRELPARPTMTMASQPQRLPAIANPLLASESLIRSVSGLLLTTANLAEVVSGLPTSGLKTKMRGASGASASGQASALLEQQPRAQSAAADELPQDASPQAARARRLPFETSMRR